MQAAALRLFTALLATTILQATAHATPMNLDHNGGVEETTMSQPGKSNTTSVTDWSLMSYNFISSPGPSATDGTQYEPYVGPAGMNGHNSISPTGGIFVAADSVHQVDGVSLVASTPVHASAVPEPASWGILAAGMVLLGMARLRNRYIAGPLQD